LAGPLMYTYTNDWPLNAIDPTGLVTINCMCQQSNYGGFQTYSTYFWRQVNCTGSASTCCTSACDIDDGLGTSWTGRWDILGAGPSDPPGDDPCPDDWSSGTDYLTCVACCVRTYEFWNSLAVSCGVGGMRYKKPHPTPGQEDTSTWLLRVRRCLPRWCRPRMITVQWVGKCSGVLFIVEGCYDFGVEAVCSAYCAGR